MVNRTNTPHAEGRARSSRKKVCFDVWLEVPSFYQLRGYAVARGTSISGLAREFIHDGLKEFRTSEAIGDK